MEKFLMMAGKREKVLQFVKFTMVGVSNTVVSYIAYLIFIKAGFYYILANISGYVISIFNSFYWNNKYVFTEDGTQKRNLWKTFFKTFCSYLGIGFIFENVLLFVFVQYLHVPREIAPIIIAVLIVPVNFLANKLWAFKDKN